MRSEAVSIDTTTGALQPVRTVLFDDPAQAVPSEVAVLNVDWQPGRYERFVKPVIDRVGAGLLMVLAAPVLAGTWLVVRVAIGRPAIFRQYRVGLNGGVFTVYKFRTMLPDRRQRGRDRRRRPRAEAAPDRRQTHKSDEDPRHVPAGRLLRKVRFDELPQLINVLKGEMSLVGPRPELVEIVRQYEPWQHQRHFVKPGMTGWWQVSSRGNGLMHEQTDIDLEYLNRISLLTDLSVLARTLPTMLARNGH